MFPQEYLDYAEEVRAIAREQHKLESYFLEDSTMIPTDAHERKNIPVYSGFMVYFPLAICAVARHSQRSNEQHNPGEPMHWDRSKSRDEQDSAARHMLGTAVAETLDDKVEHATGQAWRSMANLEKLCEERDALDVGGCMADWGPGEKEAFENSKSQKIDARFNRTSKEQEEYLAQLNSKGHGCGGDETSRYRAPEVKERTKVAGNFDQGDMS